MGSSIYCRRRSYFSEDTISEQEIYKRMQKEENQR